MMRIRDVSGEQASVRAQLRESFAEAEGASQLDGPAMTAVEASADMPAFGRAIARGWSKLSGAIAAYAHAVDAADARRRPPSTAAAKCSIRALRAVAATTRASKETGALDARARLGGRRRRSARTFDVFEVETRYSCWLGWRMASRPLPRS